MAPADLVLFGFLGALNLALALLAGRARGRNEVTLSTSWCGEFVALTGP